MHASVPSLICTLFLSGSCLFQCPDKFLRGLEAWIVNCQISYPALIPLSKILSNIKSCEIGGRFLIILITAFLSLLKRARRNRFRSGNYPCGLVPDSRSALGPVPATDGGHQGLQMESPGTSDSQTILKKNKVVNLTLLDFKPYSKATVIKMMWS